MAEDTVVRLENKSAHLKHISIGGGEAITVPPTEPGQPGIQVKFQSDEERVAFAKAIATPAVKAWIEAGELVIGGAAGKPSPATTFDAPPAEPEAQAHATHSRTPAEPARVSRRSDKE